MLSALPTCPVKCVSYPNGDVVGFFLRFAAGHLKNSLLARKDQTQMEYPDYDSALNERVSKPKPRSIDS
jgi:hypothetical protein